jgi:hypothetical protein
VACVADHRTGLRFSRRTVEHMVAMAQAGASVGQIDYVYGFTQRYSLQGEREPGGKLVIRLLKASGNVSRRAQ